MKLRRSTEIPEEEKWRKVSVWKLNCEVDVKFFLGALFSRRLHEVKVHSDNGDVLKWPRSGPSLGARGFFDWGPRLSPFYRFEGAHESSLLPHRVLTADLTDKKFDQALTKSSNTVNKIVNCFVNFYCFILQFVWEVLNYQKKSTRVFYNSIKEKMGRIQTAFNCIGMI